MCQKFHLYFSSSFDCEWKLFLHVSYLRVDKVDKHPLAFLNFCAFSLINEFFMFVILED